MKEKRGDTSKQKAGPDVRGRLGLRNKLLWVESREVGRWATGKEGSCSEGVPGP